MKRQFIIGAIGGFLGIATAGYVIFSSGSSEMTLYGVQAALFSSLGLMGAAIANSETRFRLDAALFCSLDYTISSARRDVQFAILVFARYPCPWDCSRALFP